MNLKQSSNLAKMLASCKPSPQRNSTCKVDSSCIKKSSDRVETQSESKDKDKIRVGSQRQCVNANDLIPLGDRERLLLRKNSQQEKLNPRLIKEIQSRDSLYACNLLEKVDKAIVNEYGTENADQTLSFAEIFQALEAAEKKHHHQRMKEKRKECAKLGTKRIRNSNTDDNSCTSDCKQVKLDQTGSSRREHLQSSRFDSITAVELPLSKSEERFLLLELEQDARKMAVTLFSYLKRVGEGIFSCLQLN